MSYLNALASNGLSVGLNFYSNRINNLRRNEPAGASSEVQSAQEPVLTGPTKPEETPDSGKSGPLPQTPEEITAGRVEAKAKLQADGFIGLFQAGLSQTGETKESKETEKSETTKSDEKSQDESENTGTPTKLSSEEQEAVQKLKTRDREVKAHEAAHIAASGGRAGSPSYTYQTGPDGQKYAVGGEVSVQSGGSSDPEEALRDAEAVQKSATAPANPSSQDRSVAANASAKITQLRSEIQKTEKTDNQDPLNQSASPESKSGQSAQTAVFNGASLLQRVVGTYNSIKAGINQGSSPILAKI